MCRRTRRHTDHCIAVDSVETVAGVAGLCERALDSEQSGRGAMRGRTQTSSDPTNSRFSAIDPRNIMTSKGVPYVEFSKNNSTCQRDLYIWVIVSAGGVQLLVRNLNRFLGVAWR